MLWIKNLMTSFVKIPNDRDLKDYMIGSYFNYGGLKISADSIQFSSEVNRKVSKTHCSWLEPGRNGFSILESYILPVEINFEVEHNLQSMRCYVFNKPSLHDGIIIGELGVVRDFLDDTVAVFLHK